MSIVSSYGKPKMLIYIFFCFFFFGNSFVQLMRESEQHRFENMRSLLDDKARELNTFQKQLRQQITRLVSRIDSCCYFHILMALFFFFLE